MKRTFVYDINKSKNWGYIRCAKYEKKAKKKAKYDREIANIQNVARATITHPFVRPQNIV